PYRMRIVSSQEFRRANPVILGTDYVDDISHSWYIVATDDAGAWITIDTSEERNGWCYDSFHETHAVGGICEIVALSFCDLVRQLVDCRGENFFWLEPSFHRIGNAYDGLKPDAVGTDTL